MFIKIASNNYKEHHLNIENSIGNHPIDIVNRFFAH